ncbi:MAG: DUF1559 domain-containing protein [Planctomycetes bacterium]|nr:DUF1559 domain-containing protein [Planctomycetota bacterium]
MSQSRPKTHRDRLVEFHDRLVFVVIPVVVIAVIILIALLLPDITGDGTPSRRGQCKNNLKQIGIAFYNYHDEYGSFPPAYIADENGNPMHSWRVLILPFMDQQELYDQYRFDEPWNGPHNSQLTEHVPELFWFPSYHHHREHQGTADQNDDTMTYYMVLLGEKGAFNYCEHCISESNSFFR